MTDPNKSEELDREILLMWKQDFSSGRIAQALVEKGILITRNAVIGRVYRMQKKGILHRRIENNVIRLSTVRPVNKIKNIKKKFIPDRLIKTDMISAKKSRHSDVRLINPDTGDGVTIEGLKYNGCRWVMDFKRDGMSVFCNKDEHKRSFCEFHYNLCYFAPMKRPRK